MISTVKLTAPMNRTGIKNKIYFIIIILIPVILFLLSFRYYSLNYPRALMRMDEGLIAATVRRLWLGDVIYKDFYIPYTPGLYYFYSWFIKLTGINIIITGRLWQIILTSLFSIIVYHISRRLMPRALAFFAGLYTVFVGGIGYNYHFASSASFGVFLAFITLLFIFKFYELKKKLYLISSGVFLGLTMLFFQPAAIFTGSSVLMHLILQKYIFYESDSSKSNYSLKSLFMNISIFLVSFLIIISISIIYFCFYLHISLKLLFEELFIWPAVAGKVFKLCVYPKVEYGTYLFFLQKNSLYLPIITILSMVIFLLYRFLKMHIINKEGADTSLLINIHKLNSKDGKALLLLMLSMSSYPYFHTTPGGSHWFVFIPYIHILGLYMIYEVAASLFKNNKTGIFTYVKKSLLLLFIIPYVAYYLRAPSANIGSLYSHDIYSGLKYLYKNLDNHDTLLRILVKERFKDPEYYFPDSYEYEVAGYIKNHTDPADRIYVFASGPLLYYLADRNNSTKNDSVLRGTLEGGREEEEIIALELLPPKYIILCPDFLTQQAWDHYGKLANYILSNYYEVANISNFLIFAKQTASY